MRIDIDNGILYGVYNEDINEDGSFTVPNSVNRIGGYAFYNCSKLTSVTIPNGVTSIGQDAFCGCFTLTSITIPDSVTSIELGAFEYCSSLTSVIIGNGVTSIPRDAFRGCTALTSITIPDSVTRIGGFAFEKCTGLTSIVIPESVTSIGECAFAYCTNLTSKRANYKAFSLTETGKLKCVDKIYTVGKKSIVKGELILCGNGIHYCTNLFDIFNYYNGEYGENFVIGLCEVSEKNIGGKKDSKHCARWIIPTKILTIEEVIRIMNGEE